MKQILFFLSLPTKQHMHAENLSVQSTTSSSTTFGHHIPNDKHMFLAVVRKHATMTCMEKTGIKLMGEGGECKPKNNLASLYKVLFEKKVLYAPSLIATNYGPTFPDLYTISNFDFV